MTGFYPVASAGTGLKLIATSEVTGSATSTIDFTGLDINTDKFYKIIFNYHNDLASAYGVAMFINADTTTTNYHTQEVHISSNTTASARANNANILYFFNSGTGQAEILLSLSKDGYPNAQAFYDEGKSANAVQIDLRHYKKIGTVANITQVTFTTQTANGFAVGTEVRIYGAVT